MIMQFEFWHWWALALIMVVFEALTPTGFFVSLAIGSSITGGAFLMFPDLDMKTQLGMFGLLSLISYGIMSKLLAKTTGRSQEIKQKAQALIGQDLILTMAIQNGFSEIEIEDITWGIKGPDLPVGTKVRVLGVDGDMLNVYPIPQSKT